ALPCFDHVLKATPKDARVLTWKGEAYEALGQNPQAFAAFDSAIESNPELGDAWRSKGLLHVKSEDFPAAGDALAHATVPRTSGNPGRGLPVLLRPPRGPRRGHRVRQRAGSLGAGSDRGGRPAQVRSGRGRGPPDRGECEEPQHVAPYRRQRGLAPRRPGR